MHSTCRLIKAQIHNNVYFKTALNYLGIKYYFHHKGLCQGYEEKQHYETQWYMLCRMEFRCVKIILMNRKMSNFCIYFVNGLYNYQDDMSISLCNVHILKLMYTISLTLKVLPIEFINLLSYFLTNNIR